MNYYALIWSRQTRFSNNGIPMATVVRFASRSLRDAFVGRNHVVAVDTILANDKLVRKVKAFAAEHALRWVGCGNGCGEILAP